MDTVREYLSEIAKSLSGINDKLGVIVEEIESIKEKSFEETSLSDIVLKLEEFLDDRVQ